MHEASFDNKGTICGYGGPDLRRHSWSRGDHLWQPQGLVRVDHPQQRILPQMVRGTYFGMGNHLWHNNTMQGTCSSYAIAFCEHKTSY